MDLKSDLKFYLFVRYDLPIEQQIIQTNHATFEMAYTLTQSVEYPFVPSIVLIGVPDKKALERVISKLSFHKIEFTKFHEPDHNHGLTAVATVPLAADERVALQNYKLWNADDMRQFSFPLSSVVRAPSSQEDGGRLFESVSGNHARVA